MGIIGAESWATLLSNPVLICWSQLVSLICEAEGWQPAFPRHEGWMEGQACGMGVWVTISSGYSSGLQNYFVWPCGIIQKEGCSPISCIRMYVLYPWGGTSYNCIDKLYWNFFKSPFLSIWVFLFFFLTLKNYFVVCSVLIQKRFRKKIKKHLNPVIQNN